MARGHSGADDFIAALSDPRGTFSPALLAALAGGRKDAAEDLSPSDRCLPGSSPPLTPGFDNNYVQVIQAKDHVALLAEPSHQARIVPLDGRPQLRKGLRSWSGDSRGHWEGATLVVETRNFNKRTGSFAGAGTSRDKTVTERFTRVSANALEYEATSVDPKTFQDTVVVSFPMARSDSRIWCTRGRSALPRARRLQPLGSRRRCPRDRRSAASSGDRTARKCFS